MDALKTAVDVLLRPGSAFAAIRGNDCRYFPRALGVASIAYGLSILGTLPHTISGSKLLLTGAAMGLLAGIVYLVVIYYLGKAWGGNRHWRKVFSVILYMGVTAIALVAVTVSEAYLAQFHTVVSEASGIIRLALLVWFVMITIEAIKVVNGFGTWKAIAVGLVAAAASLAAFAPYIAITGII
ncbi:MAG: hypothetical protein J4G04_05270 [Nitrosopumilaceae archaeon]|nr:hypothetical protein [Nitrosopumilaceae archaeon]